MSSVPTKRNTGLKDAAAETAKQRTEEIVRKVNTAMTTISQEIESADGRYLGNKSGKLTQAEVCRRANIHVQTLHSPAHCNSTRIEVQSFLKIHIKSKTKKEAIRHNIDRVEYWKNEHCKAMTQVLIYENIGREKDEDIKRLKDENKRLQDQLSLNGKDRMLALSKKLS
jgi:hypothetical protein